MTANATNSDQSNCAKCGSASTLYCSACHYDEERGCQALVHYCSRGCQAADWTKHKAKCLRTQRVNNLYRSVKAIQSVYYGFRKSLFDIDIGHVNTTEKKIIVHGNPDKTTLTFPSLFPEELILDSRDQEAVLAHLASADGLHSMHHLLEKLLEGRSQSSIHKSGADI
jgi:hypothetical protein